MICREVSILAPAAQPDLHRFAIDSTSRSTPSKHSFLSVDETMGAFFGIVLSLLAIFLILLVLVQRGRGGGLAGALGGMGGSSAFGAKAGDVFTRITIVVVAIWITICILAGHWARNQGDLLTGSSSTTPPASTTLQSPPGAQGSTPESEASDAEGAPPAAAGPIMAPAAVEGSTAAPGATTTTATADETKTEPTKSDK